MGEAKKTEFPACISNPEGTESVPRVVEIERVFDAPREVVFAAWTTPAHFQAWWGPHGFTTPHCSIDLRVGGLQHFCMRMPTGEDIWCRGEFREVLRPQRIVVTDSFSDPEGNIVEVPGWSREGLITVTFDDLGDGKTLMHLRHDLTAPSNNDAGCVNDGWTQSFERLAAFLK